MQKESQQSGLTREDERSGCAKEAEEGSSLIAAKRGRHPLKAYLPMIDTDPLGKMGYWFKFLYRPGSGDEREYGERFAISTARYGKHHLPNLQLQFYPSNQMG
ncbi:hypothetical protein SAY86_006944 [Trapa natans]|uniref:Uncharacterized protein n=1 Tax=Trapa natans TaxID=22666 RepID=A0AAN7QWM5_TRANT|nr:hypothetical protein SAY86_006944 [Trapa natans]